MSVMKTSSPYGPGLSIDTPPNTITQELAKAGSKAKARYPHTPLGISQSMGGNKGIKHRALTPGTSPAGS
jgi:hypothetical protein